LNGLSGALLRLDLPEVNYLTTDLLQVRYGLGG
jgi:hypothetical protein